MTVGGVESEETKTLGASILSCNDEVEKLVLIGIEEEDNESRMKKIIFLPSIAALVYLSA